MLKVIPDKNKVSKEVWNNYLNLLLNKKITKRMRINYNLFNGKG